MNNIFQSARIKLTLWYLLILMIVSFIFSIVVFTSLNAELNRNARREQQKAVAEQLKIELPKPLPDPDKLPRELVDPPLNNEIKQTLNNSRNALVLQLLIANIIVLGLSASASYLLAGKTLKPVEDMVEEQRKFISDASHELRTPLASLKTAIEVTLRMGKISYAQMKNILESNLEDVNHLEKLTNNLLIIEKLSKSIGKKNFAKVQIDDLLKNCVKRISPIADENKIRITLKSTPISIMGNIQDLEEMFNNFLDNAIKYNKKNGKVEVNQYLQNNYLYISFKDTGIGISDIDIPHLFERFYRADNSRGRSGTCGYGLGLSIASQVVKNHKGTIIVNSKVDKGTTFIVKLPTK